MDIRQLRHVLAIVDSGTVVRAAERLAMTQPALTKSIQRLEKDLGVTLFQRDAFGMRPTQYGLRLAEQARKLARGLDDALADIQALKSGLSGIVRVGASPLTAGMVLPAAIAAFTLSHPKVEIRVATTTDDLVQPLLQGEFDFLLKVLSESGVEPGAREQKLFDDRLAIVVNKNHPLLSLPPVRPEALRAFPWVLPPPSNAHRRRLEAFLKSHGQPSPHVIVEASPTAVIAEVTSRTDYLGLVARVALGSLPAFDELVPIEFDSPHLSKPFGLVWREDVALSPSCLQLMAEIRRIAATVDASRRAGGPEVTRAGCPPAA